jgi:hypothetical protein
LVERNAIRNAIDIIHDLGDPALADVVAELETQKDAVGPGRIGTGIVTMSVTAATHLTLGIDMLRDWALDLTPRDLEEDPEAQAGFAEIPALGEMVKKLEAELATYGITL